jgi:hypothetical protein
MLTSITTSNMMAPNPQSHICYGLKITQIWIQTLFIFIYVSSGQLNHYFYFWILVLLLKLQTWLRTSLVQTIIGLIISSFCSFFNSSGYYVKYVMADLFTYHQPLTCWPCKVKGKAIPQHTYGGTGGERRHSFYSFMTSALDGVSGQLHAMAALYPWGKNPWYPLDRRLGGPQNQSGHRLEEKLSLPLPGIKLQSPSSPFRSQTLHWLSYPGSLPYNDHWCF